jgi:hypothetical protein
MPNRLAAATSPYLLQHADNPVDWQEWGTTAFDEARRRDVPVFLSVGYAACHWCHVMAHESFEDATVAEALNERFVSVKVDREERPDIDAVYMAATTALTGSGGWPMTCVLTPDGDPFFAGTYLPRERLLALLAAVSDAWRTRRAEVLGSGTTVASRLRELAVPAPAHPIDEDVLDAAVEALGRVRDRRRGGFGGAPKFPPSMVLEFLLRHHARTGSADAIAMVRETGEAMARGGMYDQLAGGFARYAVDAAWVVPHFEKMLYDNALLARLYAHWWRAGGEPLARRVALETADFLVRDLGTAEGGFAASLDADTEVDGHGVEGMTYVWTPAELAEVLGHQDGARAAALLSVTESGTFEHGSSTLQLPEDPPDEGWWASTRQRLLTARATRPQPARDDKVVTSWNGLAIAALAEVGALLERADLVDAARRAAAYLLEHHVIDGRLHRASRAGRLGTAHAVADDYGNLAEGLLTLHQSTGEARWLAAATQLLEDALARFRDGEGTFHDTAADAEALFLRPRGESDGAEPSGVSSLAGALLTCSALTGSPALREAAEAALASVGQLAHRDPRFAGWALAVAEAAQAGPLQVAVVGTGRVADDLVMLARRSTSPGLVLVAGEPDAVDVPLLADRPLVDDGPAAYVCRGFVCDRPVTTPAALDAALAGPAGATGG